VGTVLEKVSDHYFVLIEVYIYIISTGSNAANFSQNSDRARPISGLHSLWKGQLNAFKQILRFWRTKGIIVFWNSIKYILVQDYQNYGIMHWFQLSCLPRRWKAKSYINTIALFSAALLYVIKHRRTTVHPNKFLTFWSPDVTTCAALADRKSSYFVFKI
jgi:hypothetical protein